ncbi:MULTISPECIES: helix-turn-helix transcriptional regulator [Heyndrickxia]|uniref:helix-turn-helix transcriptional regulator n=1 Tax=Heyndrickxia TaxID=2837504 RepID=UPI001B07F07A|nr:helix-turn-helix transcriptional regulator [Heyndrickxia oleronia]GIN40095.1 hypothetical protein J19TS1_30440 [Heyndrickxia oleronia]
MHIGKRIKYIRKKNNLKLDYLGKGIVSSTHLSNYEAGRYTPSVDILILLSKKLEIDEEYLLSFDQYDKNVQDLINLLEYSILYNTKEAQEIILKIEMRKYIFHIHQELQFFLLKACYLLKGGEHEKLKYEETLINIYICEMEIEKLPEDIRRLYYYYLALKAYFNNDLEISHQYYLGLIYMDTNDINIAAYKYNLGLISKKKFDYLQAINWAKEALNIYLDNQKWGEVGEIYNFIGVIYWEQKRFSEAIITLEKAEKIYELINNDKLIAKIFHNKGLVYKAQNEIKKAVLYFKRSIEIKKNLHSSSLISYRALIDLYLKCNKSNLAKKELENAKLTINSELDYHLWKVLNADVLAQNNDITTSITLLKECIHFFEERNNQYYLKNLYKTLGDRYYLCKKYKLAAQFYKKEIILSER